MRLINAKFKDINVKEYRSRRASDSDYSTLITDDVTILRDGKPILVYIHKVQENLDGLLKAVQNIRYTTSTRTNGMVTTSRIFGYAPRNTIRNHPCRASTLVSEAPSQHQYLVDAAKIAARTYEAFNPELAAHHRSLTAERVLPNYKLGDTMYTSGIVNNNNPLLYHFDSGNFKNVWSAMFGFKDGIEGGHLSVPELGLGFHIGDRSLTLFDGQGLLHGVTPIRKTREDAVRYTVVYYSLQQMWNCEQPTDEIERLRMKRAEVERNRVSTDRGNQSI